MQRELARIKATQYRQRIARYGRQAVYGTPARSEPLTFEAWLKQGIEHYQKQGLTFELVTPSMMRIKRPGQNNLLQTCASFKDEYENEYLS